jgi:hypothetical protein
MTTMDGVEAGAGSPNVTNDEAAALPVMAASEIIPIVMIRKDKSLFPQLSPAP